VSVPETRAAEALAEELARHPDYRVLRRLVPRDRFVPDEAGRRLKHALVVDVETTGTEFPADQIIELGLVRFTYDADTGQPVAVEAAESLLEDPGRPLPPEIVALTRITDDMVRGQRIPEARVQALLEGVVLVLAHNAGFDRPFVERRLPAFRDVHWACTQRDIDWRALGVGSHSLEFLTYRHLGAFFDGHRAVDDCRATLELLATPTADGTVPLQVLLAATRVKRSRVCAVDSPYGSKDALRARGYRWSGTEGTPPKVWCRELPTSEVEAERAWLAAHVYDRGGQPLVEPVDLRRRWA
jgi:DNA polymerase-3 subunit epsilon